MPTFRSLLSLASSPKSFVTVQYLIPQPKMRRRLTNVTARVGSMPTRFPTVQQLLLLHRNSITCSWNGSCRTSFPQSQLNQTVFFISRSKLSLGSLQTCSPPNEESALDAFSDYRRPNIKMNSTVVAMDRSLPYLNTVRCKGELIFTYPLKNGVWNFCVTVIN